MMQKNIIHNLSSPVIICGMHRSGTSLISRILDEIGIFMGNDMEENHESLSFQLLNDQLLQLTHSYWDQVNGAFSFFNDSDAVSQAIELLKKKYLTKKFYKSYLGNSQFTHKDFCWGWKDPRNTITFPLWNAVFNNAKFIFIYRNGIDSVASLVTREHKQDFDITIPAYSSRCLNFDTAFSLWEDYNKFFLNHKSIIQSDNLLEIKYEDFLQSPKLLLTEITNFIKISVTPNKIDNICNKINSDRAYSFLGNKTLENFYTKIKNNEIMIKLGYNNLINE